jgi:hypothetical protein
MITGAWPRLAKILSTEDHSMGIIQMEHHLRKILKVLLSLMK